MQRFLVCRLRTPTTTMLLVSLVRLSMLHRITSPAESASARPATGPKSKTPGLPWPSVECHTCGHRLSVRGLASNHEHLPYLSISCARCFECQYVQQYSHQIERNAVELPSLTSERGRKPPSPGQGRASLVVSFSHQRIMQRCLRPRAMVRRETVVASPCPNPTINDRSNAYEKSCHTQPREQVPDARIEGGYAC